MLFRKKNPEGNFSSKNLRRRFHHLLLKKRRDDLPKTILAKSRLRRPLRSPPSAAMARVRRVGGFLAAGGALIGIIYLAFFSSFFHVNRVTLEKNGDAVSGTQLAPFLERIKGKNLLFLKSDALANELQQGLRNEILFAEVKKSYPSRVIVKVEEYPPIMNLRVSSGDTVQKFVLNQIGYPIFENEEAKDLPLVTLRADKPLTAKTVFFPPEKLAPIVTAFKKFHELFGLKILEGEWKKTERELHLKTEKRFSVWLDLTADIERQLNKLKRAATRLDISREPLEYIDLRIAGAEYEKVIFKRRG